MMTILKIVLLALVALLLAGIALGLWVHSRDQAQMRAGLGGAGGTRGRSAAL
jgi:uncharacterized protein YneF (UPF0154 family)